MATHRKLLVQMTRQPRLDPAWPGLLLTDSPATAVWDTSIGQSGSAGLLTLFSPDPWLASPEGHAAAPTAVVGTAAELIGGLAPGLDRSVADHLWLDDWSADPWAGGSYAAFGPGQYTRFADLLPRPENGIHFAGEHTSLASFGYLDGAIGSGLRTAAEVLTSLFGDSPPGIPPPWKRVEGGVRSMTRHRGPRCSMRATHLRKRPGNDARSSCDRPTPNPALRTRHSGTRR